MKGLTFNPVTQISKGVSAGLASMIDQEIQQLNELKGKAEGATEQDVLSIVDKIYSNQNLECEQKLDALRQILLRTTDVKPKTLAEENLEELEARVIAEFADRSQMLKIQTVSELENKIVFSNETEINKEKLKGKFRLCFNHDLNMDKKIEKFAGESVAFYLHKQGNFIKKLESQVKEAEQKKE